MDLNILVAIAVALLSLIAGLITNILAREQRKLHAKTREDFGKAKRELRNKLVHDLSMHVEDKQTRDLLLKELIAHMSSSLFLEYPQEQKEIIEREVKERTATLKERLDKIEERFPEESTLDKLASINDAIIGTKFEELHKSVERLEERLEKTILSKWDVAKIVFVIIGALGALVSLAITIIKFTTDAGGA